MLMEQVKTAIKLCHSHYIRVTSGETAALDATTTICHRYTPREQLTNFTRLADIIISAAG
jgi:hypothetical protein